MIDEPITYDRCRELANSALRDIAAALISHAEHDHWGDDCGDYINAARDQLSWLTTVLVDLPEEIAIANFTYLLTSSQDELQTPTDACPTESRESYPGGFIYGYADHHTDISDLMIANRDED